MEDSGRPDPFCWVRIQIWKLEGQVQEIYFIIGIGRANHDIDENQQDDQDYARYEGSGTKQMGLVLEGVSLHDRCRYFLFAANAMITISFVIAIMITFSGEWALQVRDATETRWATAFFEVQRKVIFNLGDHCDHRDHHVINDRNASTSRTGSNDWVTGWVREASLHQ